MNSTWIIFSILPPLMWSITNHTDKYLVTKYLKNQGGASIIILSALFGVMILPYIMFMHLSSISMSFNHILLLMLAGALTIINYLFYIFALSEEETSVIVPLYQTIPVFSFILGYFFLGETLSIQQMIASVLIIFGSILISLDLKSTKLKIKNKILFLMLSASLMAALTSLIFKYVAIKESYWGSSFWVFIGLILAAIILLIFVKKWRQELIQILKQDKFAIIGLNTLNEVMNIGASLIFSYATLIAPLALVAVISNGFQPIFVLLFALIFSIFIPKYVSEELSRKHLIQKIISVVIIFIGTYLLN